MPAGARCERAALRDDRAGARPVLLAPPRRVTVAAGRERARSSFATGVADTPRRRRCASPRSTRDPRSAQRAIDLAWTRVAARAARPRHQPRRRPWSSSGSRRACCSPTRTRRSRSRRRSRTGCRCRACGRSASRATCRSCSCASSELEHTPLVRQALLAHQYWRHKGLPLDLVILNTRPTAYARRARRPAAAARAHRTRAAAARQARRRLPAPRRPDASRRAQPAAHGRARDALTATAAPIELQLNRRGKQPRAARRARARSASRSSWPALAPFERPQLLVRQRLRRLRPARPAST